MKNLLGLKSEKLEELPKRELKEWRHRRQNRKHFWGNNYPANKVNRFLRSSVGQPWDQVFSKFHSLDWIPKNMRNLEHIKRHVVTDTFMENGKVCHIARFGRGASKIDAEYYETFYVHPETKLLCVTKPKRAKSANKETMRILGDYHQLLQVDGIWFEVRGKPINKDNGITMIAGLPYEEVKVAPVIRTFLGKPVKDIAPPDGVKYKQHEGKLYLPVPAWRMANLRYHKGIGPRDRMVEEKTQRPAFSWRNVDSIKITLFRQLNSKELKKHGLQNEAKPFGKRCKKCGGIVGKDCLIHVCYTCDKYLREDCKCWPWGK